MCKCWTLHNPPNNHSWQLKSSDNCHHKGIWNPPNKTMPLVDTTKIGMDFMNRICSRILPIRLMDLMGRERFTWVLTWTVRYILPSIAFGTVSFTQLDTIRLWETTDMSLL